MGTTAGEWTGPMQRMGAGRIRSCKGVWILFHKSDLRSMLYKLPIQYALRTKLGTTKKLGDLVRKYVPLKTFIRHIHKPKALRMSKHT